MVYIYIITSAVNSVVVQKLTLHKEMQKLQAIDLLRMK